MEFIKFLPDISHSLTFLVKNTSWPSIHMSIHLCNVQLTLMYNSRQGWLAAVKPACWHTGPAATVERGGLQRPVHAVPSHSSSPLSIPPSFHSFNLPLSRNLRLYPSSTTHTHYSSMYVFTRTYTHGKICVCLAAIGIQPYGIPNDVKVGCWKSTFYHFISLISWFKWKKNSVKLFVKECFSHLLYIDTSTTNLQSAVTL